MNIALSLLNFEINIFCLFRLIRKILIKIYKNMRYSCNISHEGNIKFKNFKCKSFKYMFIKTKFNVG